MIREIIFYQNHFTDFYQKQDEKVKSKIKYTLDLIRQVERVPDKFLKHMIGYDGLYEVRVQVKSNIYRIFCCFDNNRIVVLFNGFQKKTQKTPQQEIDRAVKLKEEYFKNKI
ncbi:type II toxin-antitoxin system RelE/ParE family toxin [Albibacterium indicum]|uniref:type II toxin-antitoxin system RelE/ParE family toxin n=1 Tax=Albibacterium indicum TaxID=2292082 RepID=UPI000E499817|nr:type II toxin-antitoxin system RelE/ParE family toxin [Pedobacter indicus]